MSIFSFILILSIPFVIVGSYLIGTHEQVKNTPSILILFIASVMFLCTAMAIFNVFDDGYKKGQVDAINGEIIYQMNVTTVLQGDEIIDADTTYTTTKKVYSDKFGRRLFLSAESLDD